MLGEVLRFEWRYQTRQVGFFVAVAAFVGLAFVFVGTGYGPDNVHINSPYSVMQSLGLLSLFSVFVLGLFCANAALRDSEHKMEELVFATSISKPTYLAGRFIGALLAALTVFAVATLGLMVAPHVVAVEPERLGDTEVLRYVWALAVMVLPNLLFAASLLFAVSVLTRSALASYIGAVFLYALYFVGSLLGDSPLMAGAAPQTPESLARAAVLDPFGLSAFFAQTRYWTEAERNTRLLALEGPFLLNRLLWLGVSACVLGFVYWRFTFRVASGSKTGKDSEPVSQVRGSETPGTTPGDEAPGMEPGRLRSTDVASAADAYRPVEGHVSAWAALRSSVGLESRYVLKSGSFLALLALWLFVVGMEVIVGSTRAEYGTRLFPTTGLLLPNLQEVLSLIGTLTVIYFGTELVWRERVVRMSALLDATPASSAVFYLSKLVVLAMLLTALAVAAVGLSVLFQFSRGYFHVEPALYLSLLYFTGLPLLLFAVAALWLQTLSPNRYVGMFLALLLALALRQGERLGLEHGLLRYASGPPVRHSDMDGFGAAAASFSAFMAYWSVFAGLLGIVTVGLWRRGVSPPLRERIAALPRVLGRSGRASAAVCLGVFAVTGAFIFHGTNVLNRYETRARLADWKADYEKTYQRYETLPQPSVVTVKTTVDLFPEERRYQVAGTQQLENRTSSPIDTVWVSVQRDVSVASLTLAGATLFHHDARFGMYEFRLGRSMPPGARAELAFTLDVARRGFDTSEPETSIVENGSFIANIEAFPSIGYRKGYELRDERERRKRGLPQAPVVEADAEGDLGPSESGSQRAWTTLETTLSTSEDQVAVAPGALRREWREGGRRYFHYVMDRPMLNWFAFVSARYAVEKVKHRGIDVEVYFHPAHAHNVARILAAATRSLDVFGEQFGPYPHAQLRIVEVPSSWGFGALALSNTIYSPEHRGFLSDLRDADGVDLVTRRIAHEVAHQWWGHQVEAAGGPGASFITESLAKYSEQLVLKSMYGEPQVRKVLAFDLDRYLRGRASEEDEEPPLTGVKDQPYLYYGKGAVVMSAVSDLLGEETVNRALRRFVKERAYPNPQPDARDLVAALGAEASEAHRALIEQWMTQVVFYDLKVESATYEPLADGRYRVTARIAAAKKARRGTEDVPLAMDESLDVVVSSEDEAPLYAAKHRFTGAVTEVSVIVNERPVSIGVDPFLRRIEQEKTDNVSKLVTASAPVH